MPSLSDIASWLVNTVWSTPLFLLLLGCGLTFTIVSKFAQWRILAHGYACVRGHYDNPNETGHINHFQALCAALSATIGLGNIAGVAVAISLGGPGAVFWMWVAGLFGMALKYMECTLAVMFRDVRDVPDPSAPALTGADAEERTLEYEGEEPPEPGRSPRGRGEVRGGPMWYMQKALVDPLKQRGHGGWVVFKILAVLFATATILNSFGGGNMFQGWNVSDMLNRNFQIPQTVSACLVAVLVALVIIGGIKRIGAVAGKLVPLMCVLYVGGALVMILMHAGEIPHYISLIIKSAFQPTQAGGAFAGASIWVAFTWGLKRACFSNEAGEGSAAMAHAAARTEEPVREGVVAGIGPFIDTIIICTLSALVLLMSGVWERPEVGEVSSIDGNRVIITRTADELPASFEQQYLDLIVPNGGANELSVHTVRGTDNEPDSVTAPITRLDGQQRTDEADVARPMKWTDWQTLTLNLKDVKKKKEKLAAIKVGQPVHLEIDGAAMTAFAFDTTLTGFGQYIITVAVVFFAFSTMISWSYYGEKGAEYLFGAGAILPYKFVFVVFVFLGMILPKFSTVYDFSDATTGMMVICNLPAVLILSPHVLRAAQRYFQRLDAGEMTKYK